MEYFVLPPTPLSESGTDLAEAPADGKAVAQHSPCPSNSLQGSDSAAIAYATASALGRLATWRLRLPCRLQAASLLGRGQEQLLTLALSLLPRIMASGPAGSLVHPLGGQTPRRESHGRECLWWSLWRQPYALPALTVPIPSGRHCHKPVGNTLQRRPPSPDVQTATTATLGALAAAAELQVRDFAAPCSYAYWAREQPVEPKDHATV